MRYCLPRSSARQTSARGARHMLNGRAQCPADAGPLCPRAHAQRVPASCSSTSGRRLLGRLQRARPRAATLMYHTRRHGRTPRQPCSSRMGGRPPPARSVQTQRRRTDASLLGRLSCCPAWPMHVLSACCYAVHTPSAARDKDWHCLAACLAQAFRAARDELRVLFFPELSRCRAAQPIVLYLIERGGGS